MLSGARSTHTLKISRQIQEAFIFNSDAKAPSEHFVPSHKVTDTRRGGVVRTQGSLEGRKLVPGNKKVPAGR